MHVYDMSILPRRNWGGERKMGVGERGQRGVGGGQRGKERGNRGEGGWREKRGRECQVYNT